MRARFGIFVIAVVMLSCGAGTDGGAAGAGGSSGSSDDGGHAGSSGSSDSGGHAGSSGSSDDGGHAGSSGSGDDGGHAGDASSLMDVERRDAQSDDATADEDAADDVDATAPGDEVLCTGGSALQLVAVRTAGGMVAPGSQVMSENGYLYLLVEGNCRFWVFAGGYAHVKTGTLSVDQRERLIAAFKLDQWEQWIGDYYHTGWYDYPSTFVAYGQQTIDQPCAMSQMGATGCVSFTSGYEDTAASIDWLETALLEQVDALSQAGAAADGDIRYVLAEIESAPQVWRNAPSWPLGDPTTVALTELEAYDYTPGSSTLASGEDAVALRQLWDQYLAGSIGNRALQEVIPIEASSTHYQLYLRDSIPLEDADGLLPLFAQTAP